MAIIHLPTEFKEFLQSLNSNEVEYMVVGGYPVSYYGYARTTADIDIWIRISRKNSVRLADALVEYGFDPANVQPQLFLRKRKIHRIGVPPLRIDILTDISGVKFDKCYPKRTVAEIDGIKVDIIALRDLKKNKRASGRHKDLDDLENLP
jgi:predicted nucleotidyltransferase